MRVSRKIMTKLPDGWEETWQTQSKQLLALRMNPVVLQRHFELSGQRVQVLPYELVINADETPIPTEPVSKTTLVPTGVKDVAIGTAGKEKERITAMLAVSMSGHKFRPMLIYKAKESTKENIKKKNTVCYKITNNPEMPSQDELEVDYNETAYLVIAQPPLQIQA